LKILENAWWLPNVFWIESARKCLVVAMRFQLKMVKKLGGRQANFG
jgi:hypothetical protein